MMMYSKQNLPYAGATEEYKSCDAKFMPISLSMGRVYLYVTSQSTNQVQVFLNGEQKGVLKMNNSKYFNSLHNVHTVTRKGMPEPAAHQVVVLDNSGFHFFREDGLFSHTVLANQSHKYRGLGAIHHQGKFCLVSLEVKDPNMSGVNVVVIDVENSSSKTHPIVKRIKIPQTEGLNDELTKCRFLTVTPDEKRVYVTSLVMDTIFSVDLVTEDVMTFNHGLKEPAGIAIDPKSGYIFVSSRGDRSVTMFNSDLGHLGTFWHHETKVPIGLCVHDENLYVANNEQFTIMKVPIKYV